MKDSTLTQRTHLFSGQDTYLFTWIDSFLIDRKARGTAKGTLRFYSIKLKLFTDFCEGQAVKEVTQIDPNLIRQYLLWLEETGHNPGGIHGAYRALRAFLYWWEDEIEPEGWKNPIHKVKAPKVPIELIEPVELDTVKALTEVCKGHTLVDTRDKAIFLCLLDTGARAEEFLSVNLEDVDITGAILIRQGKGKKPRTVYLGQQCRKALRAYLKHRSNNNRALWINNLGERLKYDGLRAVMNRRAGMANVKAPTIHDFRRAFALNCLKNGMDIYTLQKLMGHADLTVLRRYLKQTEGDLRAGHAKFSPVDRM